MKADEFLVLARRWLEEPGSRPVSPPGGFYERLLRASLQTGHAAAAFVEQQALGRAILGEEPPAEEAPVPAKDRVRAMRERRRSGLVHCAQVDLTPGDIDLLQAYGLQLPQDRENRRAIDAALGDFLKALLTHNDPSAS